ncbi:PREDICTED: probable sodium/metabolite cotransporter BASS4, chloroplastic [Nelumbo nucifera]|uniref:Probable sodium/metabolite cotransporter BASS4, chloroplastic n=2 Tax=Nelumbo nucifera TaxID=4432 RepID=A0A822Y974_NELNU|nr:PREDICTED: probable sodium/metabolite cotransporter BASS4, chloroplastic [Nelumbo nucifera]DAD28812.1 TPA_asm: hypothetical protein HUJ06_030280 [Nelumbo nucifera]
MAGTLQTLAFRPPVVGITVPRLRNPFLSVIHIHMHGYSVTSSPNLLLRRNFPSTSRTIRASERSDQVNGNGNLHARIPDSVLLLTWVKPILSFVGSNFLPLALVSAVSVGLANPRLGCLAHKYSLSKFSTFGIFFISGLMLRSGDVGAAVQAWPAGIFGLGLILLFTPFFSRLVLQLKLVPQEFVTGLAIFSCMPTTLSSGVALTQLVGGNSPLALAMTVVSNLLGILIVPFSISKFIADGVGVRIPTEQLLRSLITTLLIPLILGKVFRDFFSGVGEYVDQNRKHFSMISAILLSLVPWVQVSISSPLLLMVKPAVFLVAIGMGILLHLILLAFNSLAIHGISAISGGGKSVFSKKENARALVLVASQKTLPVLVTVVEQLGGALGESGLLVLPCVAAHINQIIIDSFLVNFWLHKDRSSNMDKEA